MTCCWSGPDKGALYFSSTVTPLQICMVVSIKSSLTSKDSCAVFSVDVSTIFSATSYVSNKDVSSVKVPSSPGILFSVDIVLVLFKHCECLFDALQLVLHCKKEIHLQRKLPSCHNCLAIECILQQSEKSRQH